MLEMFVFFLSGLAFQLSVFYSHPLVLGMGLLIFAVIMGVVICYYGPIFSFCAFMVMVAGVLVVFSYTISLVPFKGFNSDDTGSLGFKGGSGLDFEAGVYFLKGFLRLNSKFLISWVMMVCFFFVCFFSVFMGGFYKDDVSGMMLSYTEISYFTEDYSIFIVWMGVLLFLAMVFGASMTKWYEGALVN